MPATDSLQPPLSKEERDVCKSYGGWTSFMQSYGLKPWEDNDAAEGKAILEGFASANAADSATIEANKSSHNTSGGSQGRQGGSGGRRSQK